MRVAPGPVERTSRDAQRGRGNGDRAQMPKYLSKNLTRKDMGHGTGDTDGKSRHSRSSPSFRPPSTSSPSRSLQPRQHLVRPTSDLVLSMLSRCYPRFSVILTQSRRLPPLLNLQYSLNHPSCFRSWATPLHRLMPRTLHAPRLLDLTFAFSAPSFLNLVSGHMSRSPSCA